MATYTVKRGDCLWNIAKRYLGSGTRWTELADINGISRGNPTIYVGQVIKLDTGGTAAPARATPSYSRDLRFNILVCRRDLIKPFLPHGIGNGQIRIITKHGGNMTLETVYGLWRTREQFKVILSRLPILPRLMRSVCSFG